MESSLVLPCRRRRLSQEVHAAREGLVGSSLYQLSVAALSCGLYAILITAKRHPLLQAVQIAFWHKVRDLSSAPSRY